MSFRCSSCQQDFRPSALHLISLFLDVPPPTPNEEILLLCSHCRQYNCPGQVNLSLPLKLLDPHMLVDLYRTESILHCPPRALCRKAFVTPLAESFVHHAETAFKQMQKEREELMFQHGIAPPGADLERHLAQLQHAVEHTRLSAAQPQQATTHIILDTEPQPAAPTGAPETPVMAEAGYVPAAPQAQAQAQEMATPARADPGTDEAPHRLLTPAAHHVFPVAQIALPAFLPTPYEIDQSPALFLGPTPQSNWVLPGRLLASAFPGASTEPMHTQNIKKLLQAGIDLFVNLTTEVEMRRQSWKIHPYFETACRLIRDSQAEHQRYQDYLLRVEQYNQQLAALEQERRAAARREKAAKRRGESRTGTRPSTAKSSAYGRRPPSRRSVKPEEEEPKPPRAVKEPATALLPQRLSHFKMLHFPIDDSSVAPDPETLRLVDDLVGYLHQGRVICVHCLGGHGRTGVIASLLVSRLYGANPTTSLGLIERAHALRKVGAETPTPETHVQRMQVYRLAAQWVPKR